MESIFRIHVKGCEMENKIVVIDHEQLIKFIKSAVAEVLQENQGIKDQQNIMNFSETCEYLGIHPSTLNKWKSENKIPFKRLGKRIFFSREEVLNSLKDSNYQKYKKLALL